MKRKDWKALMAIPLMAVCLSACGENTVQPNKKTQETAGSPATGAGSVCKTFAACEPLAIKGDAQAQYELASMFHEGRGTAKSRISAIYWFGNSAQKGYADAGARREAILKDLEQSAGQGDAEAQCDLAWMYWHGYGLPRDNAKAVAWFEKSAGKGNIKAQYSLGEIYTDDRWVQQDLAKAARWFEEAAKQGDASAQNRLSTIYYLGKGVPQDYAKARYWAEKSAGQGNDEGQVLLGWLYEKGYSVPQDYAKAKDLYEKAALQGNQKGQDKLAVFYRLGKGTPKDPAKASYWADKAMQQGDCGSAGGC